MNPATLDETDTRILQILLENSSLTHKEIGHMVHLTGQAVGARVRRLQDLRVIEGYTLRWNPEKIGLTVQAFIAVFMKSSTAHQDFQSYVNAHEQVVETHRVSGEGCYWIRVRVRSSTELNQFLDELLHYGNYRVSISIGQIK
ncbi:Lrp/AsnC family transcriptional regulator [Paenibacillus hexagrammi]|uniref:Lrp/AsnC family transcriptional regulator n=1 Tax=Paenibacillus hexagrammi TaxID=2908839 RepID=A0ABY3SK03_9BACL|nr:Lrp/AsnC family transcriptional regulator [Paenibacillus sp. YPD9-1]UJF34039.1 Lrp/AsnC family transcriptional regulator [Paenibacillus sp. YPD9-1]